MSLIASLKRRELLNGGVLNRRDCCASDYDCNMPIPIFCYLTTPLHSAHCHTWAVQLKTEATADHRDRIVPINRWREGDADCICLRNDVARDGVIHECSEDSLHRVVRHLVGCQVPFRGNLYGGDFDKVRCRQREIAEGNVCFLVFWNGYVPDAPCIVWVPEWKVWGGDLDRTIAAGELCLTWSDGLVAPSQQNHVSVISVVCLVLLVSYSGSTCNM